MYPDRDGNITTAIGYLCDPVDRALRLPWVLEDGTRVPADVVRKEFSLLKLDVGLRKVPARKLRPHTVCRLTHEDIDALTFERLEDNANSVQKRLFGFKDFPADAQLAVMSMCWALGVGDGRDKGFLDGFPKCVSYLRAGDFVAAASECRMDDSNNAGLTPRNVENKRLFLAAAEVMKNGSDLNVLTPVRPLPQSKETLRHVQASLKLLGYDPGVVDGKDGPKTKAAVKKFQADKGLTVDGVAGPKTKAALEEALRQQEQG